jgi:hypothetical protein
VQPQSIPCFGPRNLQGEIKEEAHIETGKVGKQRELSVLGHENCKVKSKKNCTQYIPKI